MSGFRWSFHQKRSGLPTVALRRVPSSFCCPDGGRQPVEGGFCHCRSPKEARDAVTAVSDSSILIAGWPRTRNRSKKKRLKLGIKATEHVRLALVEEGIPNRSLEHTQLTDQLSIAGKI